MITNIADKKFQTYIKHVLVNEGYRTSDQKDNAAKCAPGKVHTIYGVTYCVFKERAARLGILPVTYERFYNLTKNDAITFLFDEYKNNEWYALPDAGAFAMTEANWLSGAYTWNHAIDTLNKLGFKDVPAKKKNFGYTKAEKNKIISLAKQVPAGKFFDTYTKIMYDWFDRLGKTSYGSRFRNGWLRRQREFQAFKDLFLEGEKGGSDPFFFPIVLIASYFAYKMLKKR